MNVAIVKAVSYVGHTRIPVYETEQQSTAVADKPARRGVM